MKTYTRWQLLILACTALASLLVFYLTPGFNDKSLLSNPAPQGQVLGKISPGLPVRLTIPAININATVEHVGVNPEGEMEVPSNAINVGWFTLGSRPGEKGSAVISGHFDSQNDEVGVFANLHKLKKGDKLYAEDSKGISTIFVVKESRIYDPGYAEDVFTRSDGTYLTLITCDGVWDGDTKSYSKRLVVFADLLR